MTHRGVYSTDDKSASTLIRCTLLWLVSRKLPHYMSDSYSLDFFTVEFGHSVMFCYTL